MTIMSKAFVSFGAIFLTHAVYSAYEHSLVSQQSPTHTPSSLKSSARIPLPTDIVIETLLGTLLLIFAVVLSAAPLRPIRWSEWAGKIEREGWDPNATGHDSVLTTKGGKGNPYNALEERKGFWNVRAQREEFANWVRKGGLKEMSK